MIPVPPNDDERRERQVEGLLRSAAEWEPDAPAPEGLAFRALARVREERREVRAGAGPLRGFGILIGSLGGAAACAGIALALVRAPQPETHSAVVPSPGARVTRVTPPLVEGPAESTSATPGEDRTPDKTPDKTVRNPVEKKLTATPRPRKSRRRVSGVRLAHGAAPRRSRKPERHAPPALWTTERLRPEETAVVAPVWLVEETQEPGTFQFTPGYLSVPMSVELADALLGMPEGPEAPEETVIPASAGEDGTQK